MDKINLLKPCHYKYIDVSRGDHEVVGFIAQEVKEIIPEAVNSSNIEYIPNHYGMCEINSSNITFSKIHNFIVNDNIKCIDESDAELFFNCIEIVDEYNIIIDSVSETKELFCIGKEINNFHSLDKNVIFSYNVSATQELSRQNERQQILIDNLLLRIEALENK